MTDAAATRRRQLATTAALLCALIMSLAVAVAPAAAESGDSAEIVNLPGLTFSTPSIIGPEASEEYPFRLHLEPDQTMLQFGDDAAQIVTEGSSKTVTIRAVGGQDAAGAVVPVTLRVSEGDLVTVIVRHRAGNPAKGGAPFDYPIAAVGSYISISFPLVEKQVVEASPPAAIESPPTLSCHVPSLMGFSLRAAKTRLRAAHCSIGQIRLVAGATPSKGKVVKQFHPAGTRLAAGAPVAVKLGSR